jgi:hypothetical protein
VIDFLEKESKRSVRIMTAIVISFCLFVVFLLPENILAVDSGGTSKAPIGVPGGGAFRH